MQSDNQQRRWVVIHAALWVAANIVAAGFYLHFASKTWIEPQLRGEGVARGGDALVWGISALPVALASFLADLVLVALAVRVGLRLKNWTLFQVAIGIGLGWGLVMVVDLRNRF